MSSSSLPSVRRCRCRNELVVLPITSMSQSRFHSCHLLHLILMYPSHLFCPMFIEISSIYSFPPPPLRHLVPPPPVSLCQHCPHYWDRRSAFYLVHTFPLLMCRPLLSPSLLWCHRLSSVVAHRDIRITMFTSPPSFSSKRTPLHTPP